MTTLRPQDIRRIKRDDLDELSIAGLISIILGDSFEGDLGDLLRELGSAVVDKDDYAASALTRPLLDVMHEFELAARRLGRETDKAAARRRHQLTLRSERDAARSEKARIEAQRRVDEAEDAKAHKDRLQRLYQAALNEGLTLERYPGTDAEQGSQLWQLGTDHEHHRLLPSRFDPARRTVERFLRSTKRWYIMPESTGPLDHIEQWIEHHTAKCCDGSKL